MPSPVPVLQRGIYCRWTDANNHLRAYCITTSGVITATRVLVVKVVASVSTTICTLDTNEDYTQTVNLKLDVTAGGRFRVVATINGNAYSKEGSDPDLATGGTLATGKFGLYDYNNPSVAATRTYDNFRANSPAFDAALFASKKAQVRNNTALRQDAAGTAWSRPGSYRGDYLKVPPASHGGTVRMIVKASRSIPEAGADTGIDDITAQLTVTPRFLVISS